ncbi:hypothetical protein BU15DRAFT_66398 [Melanogaster broomeanus]|nr:hypothetical protein BU15DRAFT_66398 [Melanogaster broomeanus]
MEPRTPPAKTSTPTAAPDTVPRSKQVSGPLFYTGDLTHGRTAVLQDLQHIPVVSLEYFKDAILPPLLPKINVASIRKSLVKSSVLTEDGRWKKFSVEPRHDSRTEPVVFEGLKSIFDGIVSEVSNVLQRSSTLRLVEKPSATPLSHRNNSSRPDAYLLLKKKKSISINPTGQRHSWDDIPVSFEFKKSPSEDDRVNNEQKIIWSLHSIMRDDPCRRSAFGVTIENTEVRLWFTCRALTVVSHRFDFFKDVETLIHLFCSLAFANEVELGWDPTIERVLVGDQIHYDISFRSTEGPPTIYRTVEIISDFGADALRGRGTRIFKAYEKKESPPTEKDYVVIKDAWRDSDRMREDLILEKIFEAIAETQPDKVDDARQYFLTVLQAEDVMVDNETDNTLRLLHGKDIPDGSPLHDVTAEKEPSQRSHTSSVGNIPSAPLQLMRRNLPAVKSGDVHHKQHFRIVFSELGEPIFDLKKLDGVLQTLGDGLKGLEYMHIAGWVHRDVSAGNVLRCNGRGKITDLEYAKSLTSSSESHDVRTGTADFMACEVEGQRYLCFLDRSVKGKSGLQPPRKGILPPFRFNPLHDLESWWWILTWVLHYHVDSHTEVLPPRHQDVYRWFFPGVNLPPGRTRLDALRSRLQNDILPKSFHTTALWADNMRAKLLECYHEAERSSEVDYKKPTLESTEEFFDSLKAARDMVTEDVTLVPSHIIKKRNADLALANDVGQIVSKRSRQ